MKIQVVLTKTEKAKIKKISKSLEKDFNDIEGTDYNISKSTNDLFEKGYEAKNKAGDIKIYNDDLEGTSVMELNIKTAVTTKLMDLCHVFSKSIMKMSKDLYDFAEKYFM